MKPACKSLLTLFMGMALISCAGTDSSAQKKGEENLNLFKAGTPAADSLTSKMPEFAHSVFKGTLDSVPGEYYYHVTDGRVDTLFKKESGQYKPIASIAYDSLNGQNSYELKKGNCSYFITNGVLEVELDFPKYIKAYWDNGKPKNVMSGLLYRDDYGVFLLDSGRSEIYFEDGKIYQQNDWRDKQPVAGKEWNENGTLVKEIDFPKSYKEYWDNGKPKGVMTGFLYRDDQGNFLLDSGHAELYFENGKIQQKNDRRNKLLVTQKDWNEDGVLTKDVNFPQYYKEYWDDGKPKTILTGLLYRSSQEGFVLDSGHLEVYFKNGKIKEQSEWKNKQPFTNKQWNENGVLINELDFPKSIKEYWDNGNPKAIATGLFYKNDQGVIRMDSGHSETYFENGKIKGQSDSRDKQVIASKTWNENGVLIKELVFPKSYKEFWDNGKPQWVITGTLYRDNQGNFLLDSGHAEIYFENGKMKAQEDWKDKQVVTTKAWNENGILIQDHVFPKYANSYWDNGKPKAIMTGLLYRDNHGRFLLDSGRLDIYFENGKIQVQSNWKDKQVVAQKTWNENRVLIKDLVFPKQLKEYWDNGKPKAIATGLLYRANQGNFLLDSGHLETYFENGKIKEQIDWKDNLPVASKLWNENGILIQDYVFPKYANSYWDNGKPEVVMTGLLYRDGQGKLALDSGHKEIFFENGKINQKNDWKNKQPVAGKGWYENGVLKGELDFPKFYKEYWDNGKPKAVLTGLLYRNSQGDFALDSGHQEVYFENGKIHYQRDWKDKQVVVHKEWNENGVLTTELDFPKYLKEYWDNGKTRQIATGILYRADQGDIRVDSGHSEAYYENGKIGQQNDWKNKRPIASKQWNEKGTVMAEADVSRGFCKSYFLNGKPAMEISGKFHFDDNGDIILENASKKEWNENGTLTTEIFFPKYVKYYSDSGTLSVELEGTLYYDDQGRIQVQDGFKKWYHENGELWTLRIYKEKKLVGKKKWGENGTLWEEGDVSREFYKYYRSDGKILIAVSGKFHYDEEEDIILENATQKGWKLNGNLRKEIVFPKYLKEYSDNGTLVKELKGTLYYDDQKEIQVQDGFRKENYDNGKIALHQTYMEKKLVGKTVWNESGIVTISVALPNNYKEFYDDGKIKAFATGTIVEENGSFRIQDGIYNEYSQNGEITYTAIYKDFQIISEK